MQLPLGIESPGTVGISPEVSTLWRTGALLIRRSEQRRDTRFTLDATLNPSAQGLAVIKKQTEVSKAFPEVMNRNRTNYSHLDKCYIHTLPLQRDKGKNSDTWVFR